MKNKVNSRFPHRLLSSVMLPVAPRVVAVTASPGLIAQSSRSRFRKLVAVAFSSLLLAALLAFVMTAAADKSASTPSSPLGGSCVGIDVTSTADSGAGSLRQAIIDANNNAGLDTICFNIAAAGVQTITPLSGLPPITSPVIIDGYSQPGSSANTLAVGSDATLLIELNGTSAGAGVNGLTITAGGSTVRGLVINRFSNVGIALATSGVNTIQGNYIGTNAAGTANLNNANVGVFVSGTPNNLIGGTAPAARNVLSGNPYGVYMTAAGATGNMVQGNYVGMDKSGTVALGNTFDGVLLQTGPGSNTIGGTASGAGNVISGNGQDGVSLFGANSNTVQGNLVGTDATGTLDRGNARYGVIIRSGASGNNIGGSASGARNVISGNALDGINISESSNDNTVEGNYIGTNAVGTADLGNSQNGIRFDGLSSNTTIGGTTVAERNVISGNDHSGVRLLGSTGTKILGNFIGTNATGTAAIGNNFSGIEANAGTSNLVIGGTTGTSPGGACTGACNLVSGNGGSGIEHVNGGATVIQGNYVGTDLSGTADLGNASLGIDLSSNATGDTIGGTSASARNVISGNNGIGVNLTGGGGHTLLGNYVGLNAAGTAALGNSGAGVTVGSAGNTVGGTTAGAGNVISGNTNPNNAGVEIRANNNTVQGNFIGTNAAGTAAVGNSTGIFIVNNATGALIGGGIGTTPGGACTGACNLISGNSADGILIGRPFSAIAASSSSNIVRGNLIGTTADGAADLGNAGNGVVIRDSANNIIGGTTANERNVISGNNESGVRMDFAIAVVGSTGNLVRGNYIGTNSTGTGALGNSIAGVFIDNSSTNTVGGPAAGQGNLIAFNTGDGVFINSGTGNAVRANSILNNNELGIDLNPNGLTPNDTNDTDTGANNLQNFPVLTDVTTGGGNANILGTLDTALPSTAFTLEFFSSDSCNASAPNDFGEGQTLIHTTTVTTDASGDAIFNQTFASSLSEGKFVTATATDPAGNTSEFSQCRQAGQVTISIGDATVTEGNSGQTNAGFAVNISRTRGVDVLVSYTTADNTATDAGNDYEPTSGSVTITAGFTSAVINVPVNGDNKFELNDTFFVNITATNADLADAQGVGTITNDDSQPTITIGNVSANEGNAGSTSFDFSVTLSNPSYQTITVNFQTADNTATDADNDYEPRSGSVTITENNTSAVVSVTVNGDSKFELTETFFVDLSGATNATVTDAQGAGTIANDDSPPSITISDVSDIEGNTGTKNFNFTVTLSAQSGVQTSVTYSTADGNAQAGSDYAAASGPLTFAPGELSKPVVVQVSGDTDNEVNENFFINLSGEDGATLADSQGQGTILNDDGPTAAPALIGGQITHPDGTPLGGVVMTLSGGHELRRAITDAQGNYLFTNVDTDGFYIVTPARANYLFSPAERSFPLLGNKTDAVFSASVTAESSNPLDTPEFFVRQNYLDFLGREPEQEGLDYWTAQIRACGSDQQCLNSRRVGVSAAFYIEQEFQDTGNFVHRVYVASLGRKPRYEEFIVDRSRISLGSTVTEQQTSFVEAWVARDAFQQTYPLTLSAAEFVNRLFDSADLQPFAAERQQQIDAMLGGKTRAQVLRDVIQLPGFKQREFNAAFVLMEYFGFLRREAEPQGFEFWLGILNNRDPNNYRGMVCSFITSAEYQQRFSGIVTHTNAECGP